MFRFCPTGLGAVVPMWILSWISRSTYRRLGPTSFFFVGGVPAVAMIRCMPGLSRWLMGRRAIADWYRFSQGARTDFANSWQGLAGFERTDASGNNVPATGIFPPLEFIQSDCRSGKTARRWIRCCSSFRVCRLRASRDLRNRPFQRPFGVCEIAVADWSGVSPNAPIVVQLEDGGSTQVKQDAIKITLDGNVLAASVSQSGNVTTATASPPNLLPIVRHTP